jgi:hypothetical protein
MTTKLRFEWDSAGFKALLNSPQVTTLVETTAEKIVAKAGEGFYYDVKTLRYGGGRVGAIVYSDKTGTQREAEDKALTQAVASTRV